MKIFLYILTLAFVFVSCRNSVQKNTTVNDFLKSQEKNFKSGKDYSPLSFIKEAQKNIPQKSLNFVLAMNDFPKDWVKTEDLDSLVAIIDSKEKCNCYLNPFSSYIPNDSAEVGGFAIEFIKAFKENKQVDLGLYSCPKINKKEAEEIKSWWKSYRKTE